MADQEIFYDLLPQYKEWLKQEKHYKEATIRSRVSNIKTIAENYDLIKEFSIDECQSVLSELQYSRRGGEPETSIVIKGDYYTGLSTYRQCLKLFVEFLKATHYSVPVSMGRRPASFNGSFDEFKRFVGPKCRNEVNVFCKSERDSHNGVCEYCGKKAVLQSAHIKERPVIIKEILDRFYLCDTDYYEVNLEEFFKKFKDAHMPVHDHIFFLCHDCHDALDKDKSITIADIKQKRTAAVGA